MILPRDTMEQLAQAGPVSMDNLEILMKDLPWRLERFGPEILKQLNK